MKKDLPLGYEQAIQLKIYEGQLVWSRSESMLTVNTILLAAIGIFLNSEIPNNLVLLVLSIFGLVFSFVWLITSIRGFAFNKFWSFSARDIEENSKEEVNNKKVETLDLMEKGEKFKNDEEIEFKFMNKYGHTKRYQRPYLARIIKMNTEVGVYTIISIFIALYIGLFVLSVMDNTRIIRVNDVSKQNHKIQLDSLSIIVGSINFGKLISNNVFWTAIGAIGTIITSITVFFAYNTFKKDMDLSKLRFENAVEISIRSDGVYHILNNSDEAIKIYQINQILIRGTELGIKPDYNSSLITEKLNSISEIKFEQKQFLKERWIVPSRSFVFGDSLTHLPMGYEEEAIWIVISEVFYQNRKQTKSSYKVSHRFSKTLEPRLIWVEFTNWIVGNVIPQ